MIISVSATDIDRQSVIQHRAVGRFLIAVYRRVLLAGLDRGARPSITRTRATDYQSLLCYHHDCGARMGAAVVYGQIMADAKMYNKRTHRETSPSGVLSASRRARTATESELIYINEAKLMSKDAGFL